MKKDMIMTKKRNLKQRFDLKTAAQLQTEIEDLQIQLALRKMEEAAYEKIANEELEAFHREDVEMKEAPKAEWSDSRSKGSSHGSHIPLRVAIVCITCLMVFLAGAGAGIAATNYLQLQVGVFAVTHEPDAINFQFQTAPESISVPARWQGKYFPAYIPEGFSLTKIGNNSAHYENVYGVKIVFKEKDAGEAVYINSENAIITHERIGMRMATISEMENLMMAVFSEGDRILSVYMTDLNFAGDKNKEELLKITENIMMLKKNSD
ncbi:MAG: DUF4367 domain-containing protein [Clostridiales bacterium]|nr:DUF4367 domain-containing protein [Clostridiales bacterium]